MLLLAALSNLFGVGVKRVSGASMLPTLAEQAVVFVLHEPLATLLGRDLARFEVVTLKAPYSGEAQVKRIIALPGETIHISGGVLYINGATVFVPHRGLGTEYTQQTSFTVPAGHVFVLGDNRLPLASRDSRQYGAVPLGNITGRVLGY